MKRLLFAMIAVASIQSNVFALDQTSTEFYYPTGTYDGVHWHYTYDGSNLYRANNLANNGYVQNWSGVVPIALAPSSTMRWEERARRTRSEPGSGRRQLTSLEPVTAGRRTERLFPRSACRSPTNTPPRMAPVRTSSAGTWSTKQPISLLVHNVYLDSISMRSILNSLIDF